MTRAEALRIGKVIADRWYRHNKPFDSIKAEYRTDEETERDVNGCKHNKCKVWK